MVKNSICLYIDQGPLFCVFHFNILGKQLGHICVHDAAWKHLACRFVKEICTFLSALNAEKSY